MNFGDPFGLCTEPEKKNNTICVALFIKAPTTLFGDFLGDDRGFSAYSPASRANIIIDLDAQTASIQVSPTCASTGECRGPLGGNPVNVTFGEGGAFTVSYDLKNGFEVGPAINGSVTFTPNGKGGYTSSGNRDAYPSFEAYHWKNGQAQIIQQRPERSMWHLFGPWPNDKW